MVVAARVVMMAEDAEALMVAEQSLVVAEKVPLMVEVAGGVLVTGVLTKWGFRRDA